MAKAMAMAKAKGKATAKVMAKAIAKTITFKTGAFRTARSQWQTSGGLRKEFPIRFQSHTIMSCGNFMNELVTPTCKREL